MPVIRSLLLAAIALMSPMAPAHADEIASLPLGDPTYAYTMASAETGQIFSRIAAGGTGMPSGVTSLEMLAAQLDGIDVVIIGENHTSMAGHEMQWQMLRAIAATGRPFALGMEFFEIQDDEALARYAKSETDLPTMLDEAGWYAAGAYNFDYYRPLVETCREHRAPIYGLNIPRDWVREMSRKGPEGMAPEKLEAIGELGPIDEKHKFLINQMMGGIGAAMPQMFDGMYRGQTSWDAAMATSIVRAHKKHLADGTPRTIVVIVGSGHMAHGLGIPARLKEMDPSLKIRTIGSVMGTRPSEDARVHPGFEKKETAVFSLGYADYAYIIPDDGMELTFPEFGVRFEHPKDAASPTATPLRVSNVVPGSVADRTGLLKGDTVMAIDGESPLTPRHAGAILAAKRWNDRVTWTITRAGVGGELKIPMLVIPPTDADGYWLKSKPASGLLDSFDPTSDRSYLEDKSVKPAAAHARVVTFRNKPIRIDVVRDGVLLEAWTLDDNGRPVLGMLSSPARDGAVRIEIDRDADGKSTNVRRRTAAGDTIEPPAAANPHPDIAK